MHFIYNNSKCRFFHLNYAIIPPKGKPMESTDFEKKEKRLTAIEKVLLLLSFASPIAAFIAFQSNDYLNLASSLIGIATLFLLAKANCIGTIVSMAFSISYAIVSYRFRYYGEMMLYLFLYLPIEVFTLIVWFRNRYGNGHQVKVERTRGIDFAIGSMLAAAVTFGAYFLLRELGTENLIWSTVSVFTSMIACYFLLRRTSFYAIFYSINDVILIILWVHAAIKDSSYACMAVCFTCFLANDLYGFFSWTRIRNLQAEKAL